MIFLDAYASWCGPCKMLQKNVFTKKAVGDFYNSKFINVKMDMEKGEGPGPVAGVSARSLSNAAVHRRQWQSAEESSWRHVGRRSDCPRQRASGKQTNVIYKAVSITGNGFFCRYVGQSPLSAHINKRQTGHYRQGPATEFGPTR